MDEKGQSSETLRNSFIVIDEYIIVTKFLKETYCLRLYSYQIFRNFEGYAANNSYFQYDRTPFTIIELYLIMDFFFLIGRIYEMTCKIIRPTAIRLFYMGIHKG